MHRCLRWIKGWIIGSSNSVDAAEYPAPFRNKYLARYGLAIGTVTAASALTLGIKPLWDQPPTLLFFTAVILTSWYAGTRAGVLATVLSIIVLDLFFIRPIYSLEMEELDLVDVTVFAGATLLISSLQARWRRAHRKTVEAEQEMQFARNIQQQMFPTSAPLFDGFDIAGVCLPISSTGGDFFDYVPIAGDSLGIIVGDVSGHGLGPALGMALVHAYLRGLALTQTKPDEILTRTNEIVCRDTKDGWFATVFLARLVPPTRSLTYAGAGHEAYLLDDSGQVTKLKSTGLPLGVLAKDRILSGSELTLQPGQILLIMSDGIVETMSPAHEQFGLTRAMEVVRRNRQKPAREIVDALCQAARDHAGSAGPQDDMTAVVVKVDLPKGREPAS